MVTEIRIYFEGDKALRPGFHQFLSEIRSAAARKSIRFQLIAGNSNANAEEDWLRACTTHLGAWNILVKDSEGKKTIPNDSVFLMVRQMEAWFLADPTALAAFYGQGFNTKALAKNPNVEEISKVDIEEGLKRAIRPTQKGRYHKTAHAPHILARLEPAKVRKAAPNCDRLFRDILKRLES